ncbi:dipeptidase [Effusibacillus lacus]|uniref:Dipeptidase n=1 Tax=Effusibacillus lacus TaxID=1348429 RepID=A0A292YRI1_9BACL|nr:dipeptidase [Effusibacillus lacus]TCS76247.1 dipeptidase [Effusibacillus lacus]GAX91796.1 dipeptidase [Effusibacillus lacus]
MSRKPFLIDGHADILYRMEQEHLDFYDPNSPLQLNYSRMERAGIDLQFFALYVDPPYTPQEHLSMILACIETFRSEVCRDNRLRPVYNYSDIERNRRSGVKSALLSIEGGDFLTGDLRHLRILYSLGVRAMGLTWNFRNSIASGVGEKIDNGLTPFGREVVLEMNRLGMLVDVSHLAPQGFWNVLEITQKPVIASHSNAKSVCPHKRNLDDSQIKGISECGGVVGVTFVPYFIGEGDVGIDDLLRHMDHIIELAGDNHIGLGSDFDGIPTTMTDLRNGEDYPRLIARLQQVYGDEVTAKICGGNLLRVLKSVLKQG